MIDLVFIEPDAEDYAVASPEFTHQVFDEEDHLEEVRFLEKPEDVRVGRARSRTFVAVGSGSNSKARCH